MSSQPGSSSAGISTSEPSLGDIECVAKRGKPGKVLLNFHGIKDIPIDEKEKKLKQRYDRKLDWEVNAIKDPENKPPFPMIIKKLCHDTDLEGAKGILNSNFFHGGVLTMIKKSGKRKDQYFWPSEGTVSWWKAVFDEKDKELYRSHYKQVNKDFLTSLAFKEESRYGNFRFISKTEDLFMAYRHSVRKSDQKADDIELIIEFSMIQKYNQEVLHTYIVYPRGFKPKDLGVKSLTETSLKVIEGKELIWYPESTGDKGRLWDQIALAFYLPPEHRLQIGTCKPAVMLKVIQNKTTNNDVADKWIEKEKLWLCTWRLRSQLQGKVEAMERLKDWMDVSQKDLVNYPPCIPSNLGLAEDCSLFEWIKAHFVDRSGQQGVLCQSEDIDETEEISESANGKDSVHVCKTCESLREEIQKNRSILGEQSDKIESNKSDVRNVRDDVARNEDAMKQLMKEMEKLKIKIEDLEDKVSQQGDQGSKKLETDCASQEDKKRRHDSL